MASHVHCLAERIQSVLEGGTSRNPPEAACGLGLRSLSMGCTQRGSKLPCPHMHRRHPKKSSECSGGESYHSANGTSRKAATCWVAGGWSKFEPPRGRGSCPSDVVYSSRASCVGVMMGQDGSGWVGLRKASPFPVSTRNEDTSASHPGTV